MGEDDLHLSDARSRHGAVGTGQPAALLAQIEDDGSVRRARRLGLVLMAGSALTVIALIAAVWVALRGIL
jgi:hypothetical protein